MSARKCHPVVSKNDSHGWAVDCQRAEPILPTRSGWSQTVHYYIAVFDTWPEAMDDALSHCWECWA